MEFKEKAIIKKCQAGDWSEFEQLYGFYINKIYAFVYFKTMHKETAEDLTSQVFLKVVEKIGKFNADGDFSAWIYTVARNTVTDYYRLKRQEADISDCWDLMCEEKLDEQIGNRQILKSVKDFLQSLKPEQREVVLMRVWGGMSFREIAQVTGKSEGSVKMFFMRFAKKMKSQQAASLIVWGILIK